MLDKILVQIALALFSFLAKKIETGKLAVDSDTDRARLIDAGNKLSKWVRENSLSSGKQSN